jgi:hypothetical protein
MSAYQVVAGLSTMADTYPNGDAFGGQEEHTLLDLIRSAFLWV